MLQGVVEINETKTPLPENITLAFADVNKMYPNCDVEEGLDVIKTKLQNNPSPLGLSPETI